MADNGRTMMAEDAMSGVMPIQRMTLHDAVLNQLRDMIIDGTLPPGTRINETQVGASLGVSRTPLREAIKSLASEGLVDILPARGATVRRFSERDIHDILEVLKGLEQMAGQLACSRASDADIRTIAALHADMMKLYRAKNRLAYFKLNQAIHTAIVAAAGNPMLAQMHDQLQARIKRIRFIGNEKPDRWAGAVAEHEEMMAALAQRDAVKLAEVLGRHLDKTMERVRDAIP